VANATLLIFIGLEEARLENIAPSVKTAFERVYSGCQKNVPIFKRFFYNRTTAYAAPPHFRTLL
jgi:hypothetical protein